MESYLLLTLTAPGLQQASSEPAGVWKPHGVNAEDLFDKEVHPQR